jgi:hypothetical protein
MIPPAPAGEARNLPTCFPDMVNPSKARNPLFARTFDYFAASSHTT